MATITAIPPSSFSPLSKTPPLTVKPQQQHSGQPKPLRTFTLFPTLPQELQDKIWSHALSTPRVYAIEINPRPGRETLLLPSNSLSLTTAVARTVMKACRAAREAGRRELPDEVLLTAVHDRSYDETYLDGSWSGDEDYRLGFWDLSRWSKRKRRPVVFRMNGKRDVLLITHVDAKVLWMFNNHVARGSFSTAESEAEWNQQHQQRPQEHQEEDEHEQNEKGKKIERMEQDRERTRKWTRKLEAEANITTALGLPANITRLAISVPDDQYYRAFNIWPLGWSDGTTNVLRRFILSFPKLETLYLRATMPVRSSGVATARALVGNLRDPEAGWRVKDHHSDNNGSNASSDMFFDRSHPGILDILDASKAHSGDDDIEWIRGTGDEATPPWMTCKRPTPPSPPSSLLHSFAELEAELEAIDDCASSSHSASYPDDSDDNKQSDNSHSENTSNRSRRSSSSSILREETENERDWYLAANPYRNWGAGIPAFTKVLDANLWREARLRKVLKVDEDAEAHEADIARQIDGGTGGSGGDDGGEAGKKKKGLTGLTGEEIPRLERVDVSMLLWFEW